MILTPIVFGSKHLFGLLAVIVVITSLLIYLNVKPHRKQTVLYVSAGFILSLEVVKYIVMYQNKVLGLNDLPFQLCSLSLYLMPLVALNHERLSKYVLPIAFSTGLLAGSLALVYPSNIIGWSDQWFPFTGDILPFISFIYHGHMIFFSLYLLTQKIYVPKFKDIKLVFFFLLGFATLGNSLNFLLNTDFMMLRYGNGNPFQFLMSYHYTVYLLGMIVIGYVLLFLTYLSFVFMPSRKPDLDKINEV